MHLDIGLPLLSELEQLCRTFWQNNNHQNPTHNQDKTPVSDDQTQCSQSQKDISPQCSDSTTHNTERDQLTHGDNHNSTPAEHSNGEQDTHDNRAERTGSQSQSCGRATCTTDVCKNGSETCEDNSPTRKQKVKAESSPTLRVKNLLLGRSNRPRKISRAMWNGSVEDASIL